MIVVGKAGAPPRPRTNVGQAGTGGNPAEPSVRACASSERRGWFGKQLSSESQCSRSGLSHSHRAWPWAPIPARPHPTRPLPDRPRRPQFRFQRPVYRVNVGKTVAKRSATGFTENNFRLDSRVANLKAVTHQQNGRQQNGRPALKHAARLPGCCGGA